MPFEVNRKLPEIFGPKDNYLFKPDFFFSFKANCLKLIALFYQSYFLRNNDSLLQRFLKMLRYAVLYLTDHSYFTGLFFSLQNHS